MIYLENYKAVGFDVFGTLVESQSQSISYLYETIEKYGGDAKKVKFLTKKYPENPKDFYKATLEKSGIIYENISEKDKNNLLDYFYHDFDKYKLIEQTDILIQEVKKQTDIIFLISNVSNLYLPIIKKLGLEKEFNFTLYSCETGSKKTVSNKKIFNLAYKKILEHGNIKRGEILFIGDRLEDDEIAAKNANFHSINIEKFREIILQY